MSTPYKPSSGFVLKCNQYNYLHITNSKGQPRVLSFNKRRNASKCIEYIYYYKDRFNDWPSFDMSETSQKIIPKK